MDLLELVGRVKELPSKKEQVVTLHEHGFNNGEIASITGATRNSVDWYISKYRKARENDNGRAAWEADKSLTRLHNVELKRGPCL